MLNLWMTRLFNPHLKCGIKLYKENIEYFRKKIYTIFYIYVPNIFNFLTKEKKKKLYLIWPRVLKIIIKVVLVKILEGASRQGHVTARMTLILNQQNA